MASQMLPAFVLTVASAFLATVCEAGTYCGAYGIKYCSYGCCGYRDQDCCAGGSVGLIVGLCVGGGVLIFVAIIVICICRRRRYGGIIYGSQSQPAYVIQQTTSQGGVVTTSGVQPGVMYPQYPYPAYPANYGNGNSPQQYPQGAAYPPQPMPHAAGPPSYESLQNTGGGYANQAFDNKN